MKKIMLLILVVFAFTIFSGLNTSLLAQDLATSCQMSKNLQEMATLLEDISKQLNTGEMSSEAQKSAATVLEELKIILQELSEIGDDIHLSHQERIKKAKSTFVPFHK